jgi:formylmethanofuran dehydrogenase subunit B
MYPYALDALAASKEFYYSNQINQALTWTRGSMRKLVVLCSDLYQEAVESAVQFARKQNAILVCEEDFSGSILSLAMKQAGLLSATLGEMKQVVQQIVCCTKNFSDSLPRFADFLGHQLLNQAVYLPAEHTLETFQRLRLKQEPLPEGLHEINQKIQTADCGLVLFNKDWLGEDPQITTELLLWLSELNAGKRWYGLAIPPAANSPGIVESLLSLTGYPGNIRFQPDGVHYDPRAICLRRLLQNSQIDICYFLGTPQFISNENYRQLEKLPTIVLGPSLPKWKSAIWLPTAQAGIDCTGTTLRLDGVPVTFEPITSNHRQTIEDLLREINREGNA